MIWTLFKFWKNWKFDDPPSDLILERIEIRENFNFKKSPLKKNISLKHLKLSKNNFKTNLFFVQLKHLKSTFTFVKKMKI